MKILVKKSLIIALSAIVGLIVVLALIFGALLYRINAAKSYCSDYADRESEAAVSSDRAYSELYELCLRDKGFGGF